MKNDVAKLIQNHRSIRMYSSKAIEDDILNELMHSAQCAPSSHNIQAYSIIIIRDQNKKNKLSELCNGQSWISSCPVFLVLCADFYRVNVACNMHNKPCEIDEIENLLVGAVDTALVAQNILVTAESYGLGCVMIGGIRNDIKSVIDLLDLPQYTIPIVGMCLGYPDESQIPWKKPRLPKDTVVFEETYNTGLINEGLHEYERISSDYYNRRTEGKKTDGWTKQIAEYLARPRRPELKKLIIEQGIKIK